MDAILKRMNGGIEGHQNALVRRSDHKADSYLLLHPDFGHEQRVEGPLPSSCLTPKKLSNPIRSHWHARVLGLSMRSMAPGPSRYVLQAFEVLVKRLTRRHPWC